MGELRAELAATGATGEALEAQVKAAAARLEAAGLLLPTWGIDDLGIQSALVGLEGSPTKVKRCENVILKTGEFRKIEPTDAGARQLIDELVHDHILG